MENLKLERDRIIAAITHGETRLGEWTRANCQNLVRIASAKLEMLRTRLVVVNAMIIVRSNECYALVK